MDHDGYLRIILMLMASKHSYQVLMKRIGMVNSHFQICWQNLVVNRPSANRYGKRMIQRSGAHLARWKGEVYWAFWQTHDDRHTLAALNHNSGGIATLEHCSEHPESHLRLMFDA